MSPAPKRTQQGDKGETVKAWQEFLNTAGFSVGKADGIHGSGTERASAAYEAALREAPAAAPKLHSVDARAALSQAQKKAIDAVLAIFETGRPPSAASYATCTVLKDGAGISYGKHQCTDKAGSLDLVVKRYIALGGKHAAALSKYQSYLEKNESAKVNPAGPFPAWLNDVIVLLKTAGREDTKMQQAQDEVFDEEYFAPALKHAHNLGIQTALGVLALYDTCIHSGPGRVGTHCAKVKEPAPAAGGNEQEWVKQYLAVRRAWLSANSNPLVQKCVYRQDALLELIRAGNWSLSTPFACRGQTVTSALVS